MVVLVLSVLSPVADRLCDGWLDWAEASRIRPVDGELELSIFDSSISGSEGSRDIDFSDGCEKKDEINDSPGRVDSELVV